MRKRVILILAVLLLIGGAVYRLSFFAEWTACFGDDKERLDLCRAIPEKRPFRQRRLLRWLLQDPALPVRSAAITAYARSQRDAALEAHIRELFLDENAPEELRSKAGLLLVERDPVDPQVAAYLDAHADDESFRLTLPQVAAHWVVGHVVRLSRAERQILLQRAVLVEDAAQAVLQHTIREHAGEFADLREEFLAHLRRDGLSTRARQFLLGCLAEIDGRMRGHAAEDWEQASLRPADPDAPHAFEAEWACEIKPNYIVGPAHGELCLILEEGAGGRIGWLKNHDGSLDIGQARFSLYAPREDEYTLYARVYLDDKCGNSFGIWLDGLHFKNFPDYRNVLGAWHWLPLHGNRGKTIRLQSGFHRLRLEAWEDGVYIDKFALMPAGEDPATLSDPPAMRWDPAQAASISFCPRWQAQPRGTTQPVIVWLRRISPETRTGTLTLSIPEPFQIAPPATVELSFEGDNPLARATFYVHLPADAIAGEVELRALYEDVSGTTIEGGMILGAQFDWLTTGPLDPHSALHQKLQRVEQTGAQKYVPRDWSPYPQKGYDTYRRLLPENAWGQLQDKYIYFCTDIVCEQGGIYEAFLNSDDRSRIYIDDQLIIAQTRNGPAEGRMMRKKFRLEKGKHRVFAQLYQCNMADPTGRDAGRHSFNHCAFKLLLRKERHLHAPAIKGLPHPLRGRPAKMRNGAPQAADAPSIQ